MDLKRMRYFCTIVEQGQISRAARLLNMAQPPLSQRLRELEEEFGYPLFTREGRTLHITDAGQLFYRRARDILRAVDEARDDVIRVAAQSGPTLRIGLSPTGKSFWFAHYQDLRAAFPDHLIGLIVGDSSTLEHLLQVGKLDFALMQPPQHAENFVIHRLATSQSVAVSPKGMLPAKLRSLSLAELARHPLLLLRRSVGVGSYERLLQSFHEAGLTADVALYSSDVDILLQLFEQGVMAIAVVPASETGASDYEVRTIDVNLPDYQLAAVFSNASDELIRRVLGCWQT